ncbi:hypothetical protein DL93DRAFT_1179088 [Clavulina sp. PMI_390]|nr:hypothetical protein DL93DRAFT_1179088 [Clavulina sp. PMI_390]
MLRSSGVIAPFLTLPCPTFDCGTFRDVFYKSFSEYMREKLTAVSPGDKPRFLFPGIGEDDHQPNFVLFQREDLKFPSSALDHDRFAVHEMGITFMNGLGGCMAVLCYDGEKNCWYFVGVYRCRILLSSTSPLCRDANITQIYGFEAVPSFPYLAQRVWEYFAANEVRSRWGKAGRPRWHARVE